MKPQKLRRFILSFVAFVIIVCALLWFLSHVIAPRLTLRVAVGADQGESQKFMTVLAPILGQERWRMRFRQINFETPEAAAKALDEGKVDLLIARGDLAPRSKGQTLTIIRRDAIALVLPPDTTIAKFADIDRKAIAIPDGPLRSENEALLNLLLDYYSIPHRNVTRLIIPAQDIGQAIRQKRALAAFVVGPANFGQVSETIASIRKTMRKPPTLLELGEASAIVKKYPQLEAMEVPQGAVTGNPPIPEEAVNTLGVTVRLFAPSSMSNSLAADIARIVTTRKATFAEFVPGAAQIEAPDTEDKNMLLPLHPGASTYFSGEQPTLFDRFENFIYYGGLFASLIGSLLAWAVGSRKSRGEREELSQHISLMLQSLREIPDADEAKRQQLLLDLDMHADWALGELAAGRIDSQNYAVVEAILARSRVLTARAPARVSAPV